MKTVLYADVLFLINFSMDFISLYLTFVLMRRRLKAVRGVAAAILGGVAGVVFTYFGISGVLSLILSFLLSLSMMFICVGRGLKHINYIKYTVILWGTGALLAGGVSLICTMGDIEMTDVKTDGAAALLILALGVAVTRFILKTVITTPRPEECVLELRCFGLKTRISALVDTGNLVVEQLSGLPVIFVKRKAFSKNSFEKDIDLLAEGVSSMDKLSPDTKRRVRIVSVQRVGETKLLTGMITSEIFIINKGHRTNVRAVMVIENVADYGGYSGIVPQSLLF